MSAEWLASVLGTAWGSAAAAPVIGLARRDAVRRRFDRARGSWFRRHVVGHRFPGRERGSAPRLGAPVVGWAARWSTRRAAAADEAAIGRELPVAIDLLAVAVGAGATPYSAVEVTARWAPPSIGERLAGVMVACHLGADFASSLEAAVGSMPSLAALAHALLTSDRFGAPVVDALARLASEERATLRRRAEAHARTVPVRLLFPLVFLILPAFGLLTVAPALLTGFAPG